MSYKRTVNQCMRGKLTGLTSAFLGKEVYVYQGRIERASKLTENFQETPQPNSTKNRDSEIIVPAEQVHELASGGHNAGNNTHDTHCQRAGDDPARGIGIGGPTKETLDRIRE